MKLRLYGKSIAIIGPVAAGKTTLLNIIKDPGVAIDPMNYDKTTDPITVSDKLVVEWKLPIEGEKNKQSIKLKLRKPKDVGGEISIRDSAEGWVEVCDEADFLVYIFDAYKYTVDDRIKKRISDDFLWIAENAQRVAAGLDEYGDISVLDNNDDILSYSDYKSNISNLPLSFPNEVFLKQLRHFQVYMFDRTRGHSVLIRSMISGKSIVKDNVRGDRFRPVPIFEVFKLNNGWEKDIETEEQFLRGIESLEFKNYPKFGNNEPGVFKPNDQYIPKKLKSPSIFNMKAKHFRKIETINNWEIEYKESIRDLLWYFWKKPIKKLGVSMCFTKDIFTKVDVCNYYFQHTNIALWKHILFKREF